MFSTLRRVGLAGILAPIFCLAWVPGAEGAQPAPGPRKDPSLGPRFQVISFQAQKLLQKPSCGLIFEDFRDSRTGLPLAARLSEMGFAAPRYFESLSFLDGTGTAPCLWDHVHAYTSIGSSTVYVCKAQLFALTHKASWVAAASTLVHEALHTLGMGENPPLPAEITHRILQNCGW